MPNPDPKFWRVLRENKASREQPAQQARLVQLANGDLKEPKEFKVSKVKLVYKDQGATQALRALLVLQGQQAHRDLKASKEFRVSRAILVCKDQKVIQAQQEPRVLLGQWVQLGHQAQWVQLAQRVLLVLKEQMALQEQQVQPEQMALREQRGRLVLKARPVNFQVDSFLNQRTIAVGYLGTSFTPMVELHLITT